MNIGYDKPLYIQPFDHRGSFQTKMFGWKGKLTEEQTAQIAAAKQVIYDGFKVAVHCPGAGRGRQEGARMADNSGYSPGLHRFRRWSHRLLGATRWMAGQKTTREEAVTEIARRYRKFVEIFEKAPGS